MRSYTCRMRDNCLCRFIVWRRECLDLPLCHRRAFLNPEWNGNECLAISAGAEIFQLRWDSATHPDLISLLGLDLIRLSCNTLLRRVDLAHLQLIRELGLLSLDHLQRHKVFPNAGDCQIIRRRSSRFGERRDYEFVTNRDCV